MKTKKQLTILDKLISAKKEESEATARRIKLEKEVYEIFESELKKAEGQETIEELGYKITINRPMKWELNEELYRKLSETLPETMQFHRVKLELDKSKYNLISELDTKFQKKIKDCVSVKPGKISVKVEKGE